MSLSALVHVNDAAYYVQKFKRLFFAQLIAEGKGAKQRERKKIQLIPANIFVPEN